MIAVLLLAAVPVIGIGVEEASHVDSPTLADIAHAFADAVEQSARAGTKVDDALWSSCASEEGERPCVEELRSKFGTSEVVLLRLYGGVTSVRVVADRFSVGSLPYRSGEVNLPREREKWTLHMFQLALAVFPDPLTVEAKSAMLETEHVSSTAIPVALLMSGLTLLAGGVTFTVLAADDGGDALTALGVAGEDMRRRFDATAAGILFGTGVLTLGASLVTWLITR